MPDRLLIADIERRIAEHLQKRQQAPKPPEPPKYWTEPVTGMEFVRIPSGRFWMGQTEAEKQALIEEVGQKDYDRWYARELPRHEVTLDGFWLAKTPVTNRQYRQWKAEHDSGTTYRSKNPLNGENQPAVRVSWEDAKAFIRWLHEQHGNTFEFRLPTEAEWEYACRAGATTAFSCGDTISPEQANYNGNYTYASGPKGIYREQTTEVGSFPPNDFDLYDMHGNVWEWCEDLFAADAYSHHAGHNPIYGRGGPDRVLRGGSWLGIPRDVRCAYRFHNSPQLRYSYIGFRLARTL